MNPVESKVAMNIKPKRAVEQLGTYVTTGDRREPYIKLDMNENTAGFDEVRQFEKLGCMPNIYPDSYEVEQMLADYLGVAKEQISLTNGSNEAIAVVSSTFIEPGEDAAVTSKPCFFSVAQSLILSGAKLNAVTVHEDLSFNIDGIERALKERPKFAMFSSPDNPTGAILDNKKILEWCVTYPETLFVIDEAYSEYCGTSLLPNLANNSNLVLLRSLSKAWGLAGFRLGAVVADPRLINYINIVKLPYSVNSAALFGAKKILANPAKIKESAQATMARKAVLVKSLRERGYKLIEGAGNFFLLSLATQCAEFATFLKEKGILVRNLTHDIKKTDDRLWGLVRVSVGTDEENRRFVEAVDQYSQSKTNAVEATK
jgi:histidinol-phosphate aminotransferase